MKKISILIALAIALGIGYWAISRPDIITVRLVTVKKGLVEATVANTRAGTIKACKRSRLSLPIGGQVDELLVDEGDRVKKGQLLLKLWNADQQARVRDGEARVVASRSALIEACHTSSLDQRELARVQGLAAKKLVSDERLDNAKTRAAISIASCDKARANVTVAKSFLELQTALFNKTQLVAPFAGVVAEINGEIGEYLTPSPPGVATPAAIDLIADDCLYVTAPIDEVDAGRIAVDMTARITLDAFRGRSLAGSVRRIAPYVKEFEKQARTVDVDVDFDAIPKDIHLLVGYSADIEVIVKQSKNTLRIPTEAIFDGDQVLRFHNTDTGLEQITIRTGIGNWVYTEVLEGIAENDQILLSLDTEGAVRGAQVQPITE